MSTAPTSATRPSESTAHPRSLRRPTQVRWVVPSNSITVISDRHTVGRDSSCDTVLPGSEVSRRHAEFRVDGPLVSVCDLDSRNGSFINGERCAKCPVRVGDVMRCGQWVGVVTADSDPIGFREIAPGWFGGATLFAAVEPATRVKQLPSDLPIVVQGETGTGKEGLARAVHLWSGRDGRLVPMNCAALPVQLVESELFGYKKGAFSGADRDSLGLIRAAQGGTLFLDEILELPAEVQAKLLRVVEQREVLPLGETRPIAVDVLVVIASQEPLSEVANDGRFRKDLFGRLDGLTLTLPAVRDRREDIVPLLLQFLCKYAGGRAPILEAKLVEALCVYDWPLNVRELLRVAQQLTALHGLEPVLKRSHLPQRIVSHTRHDSEVPATGRPKRSWRPTGDDAEFEALLGALRDNGGNVTKAAAAIGINRGRAHRLLRAYPDPVAPISA